MQLELGRDLLEQLLDALLLQRIDDDQAIAGANEELDLLEEIGFGHEGWAMGVGGAMGAVPRRDCRRCRHRAQDRRKPTLAGADVSESWMSGRWP